MVKKDTVLYYATNDEEKLLLSHLYDNYVKTYTKNYSTYSDFFGEEKTALIKTAFASERDLIFDTYGGFEGAERVISAFLVNEDNKDYPIKCLKVTGRDIDKLTHRDFLGALMGLGIKRETIGDIITGKESYIFVKEEIADYILYNLSKIGNKGVKLEETLTDHIKKEQRFEIISTTVESLRLDLIISRTFNIRRADAASLISQGKVAVSGRYGMGSDYKVKENDKISVKGKGKAVFFEECGLSKKGKIIISIKKYI